MSVYVAAPRAPGAYPGVIVGFEMFGVTGYVRGVADRIAGLGCVAVVPDFYHRFGERLALPADATGRDRGLDLLQRLSRVDVVSDVRATVAYLRARADTAGGTAMFGLSVGGHIAYLAATQVPLDAVIAFYPGWLTQTTIALGRPEPTLTLTAGMARHGARLLLLLGAQDHLYTARERELVAGTLRAEGVDHEFIVYPDTPHGFFCHERDTYRPGAAEDAWRRAAALLAALAPDAAATP
jgi:carboxymethylenebutenolidase